MALTPYINTIKLVCLSNHSHGCPFRPGVFDGCVSISAVQWLCNADNSQHEPRKRLKAFFTQLYKVGLYEWNAVECS